MISSTEAIFNNPSPAQLQIKSENTKDHVSFCSPSSESLFVKSENCDNSKGCSHSPKNISRDAPGMRMNELEVCVKEEIIEIDEVNHGVPVKSYELPIPVEVTNDNKEFIIKTLESKTGVQNIANLVFMTGLNRPNGSSETNDRGNKLRELAAFRDYSARTTDKGSTFFTCGKCEFETISRHILKQHYKNVHISELYSCEHCYRLYHCKQSLKQHLITKHHSTRVFSCSKCNFSTNKINTLGRHRRLKHNRYLFCEDCNFKTKINKQLVVHKFNRHQVQPKDIFSIHLCNICNKAFYNFAVLDIHQRVHTGERPFSCDLCDYKASLFQVLVRHKLEQHLRPKNLSCPHCRKKFIDQKSLDDHVGTSHNMIHQCSICLFQSSCKKNLLDHKKCLHRNNISKHMIHQCSICSFRSSRKKDLLSHKMYVHRNNFSKEDLHPFQCEKCLKRFTQNCGLTSHKKLWCKFKIKLEAKFESGAGLNQETSAESGKDLHSKKDLYDENEITKDLKPFQCDKCLKRYTRNGNLIKHKNLCCKFESEANSGKKVKDAKPKDIEEAVICQACNEQFPTVKVLNRHLRYCVFNL